MVFQTLLLFAPLLILIRQHAALSLEITTAPPLLDVPTYSLATVGPDGRTGMNIVTYATPVSIRPDRVWSLGLYKGTASHENFASRKGGVLQLLRTPHSRVVRLLGGTSGRDVDKEAECAELGFPWMGGSGEEEEEEEEGRREDTPLLLPGCASYLRLRLMGDLIDAGSHDVALCRVELMMVDGALPEEGNGAAPYLSTAALRDMGIITEEGKVAELD